MKCRGNFRSRLTIPLCFMLLTVMSCAVAEENRLATALAATRSAESLQPAPTSQEPPEPDPADEVAATIARLSSATLASSDLPDSFVPMSPEEFGLATAELSATMREGDLSLASIFCFIHETEYQLIYGWTIFLPDPVSRIHFDAEVATPDALLEIVASGFAPGEITDQGLIQEARDIGDSSAGLTLAATFDDGTAPLRVDIVVFRKGILGAYIFEWYLLGEDAELPIVDIAHILQDKMSDVQ